MISEIAAASAVACAFYAYNLSHRVRWLEERIKMLERPAAALPATPKPGTSQTPATFDLRTDGTAVSAHYHPPVSPGTAVDGSLAPYAKGAPLLDSAPVATAVAESLAQNAAVLAPSRPMPPAAPSAFAKGTETLMGMLKANPFASLGVLLVLVGVGFLFSLLAASNILPPALRVFLVAAAGLGVFGCGVAQEKKRPALAANLQGGAIATQFLCALWAYHGYELISPVTAFAWMGAISSLSVAWAAFNKRGLFAFMGILGALLTPILASTGHGTFSGLAGYCVWVVSMGLGTAAYLGMPSLASITIGGVSALLGAALSIPHGVEGASVAALVAMNVASAGLALRWVGKQYDWARRQQSSVVSLLLGTPLVMAGFLYRMAGLSAKMAAVVLGVTAAAYFGRMLRAPESWKVWLFSVASGLSLVAMGVGLEGASRAMAFSAAAMSVVLVARAIDRRWASVIAFIFWGISVGLGLQEPLVVPLMISGVVALSTAYLTRGRPLSALYAVLSTAVLSAALWKNTSFSDETYLAFGLAWTVGALLAGKALRWLEIQLSAVWLFPAGLAYMAFARFPDGGPALLREGLVCAGLVLATALVRVYSRDASLAKFKPTASALGYASLMLPALLSYEIVGVVTHAHAADSTAGAAVSLLWAAWALMAVHVNRHRGLDCKELIAGAIAGALVTVQILAAETSLWVEAAQWAGVAVLIAAAHQSKGGQRNAAVSASYAITGTAVVSAVLQVISAAYSLHDSTLELLFTRAMQPWVSLLWAAAGISVVVFGSNRKSRQVWMAGGVGIIALIVKMLAVDLSTFSLVAKVGVFLVTGVGFIALGAFSPLPPEAEKSRH